MGCFMVTRREFFHTASALPFLAVGQAEALGHSSSDQEPTKQENTSIPKTGSDLGNLFPFIYGQAVKSDFPLSFLSNEFKDLAIWKRAARAKLLDLLHYSPPKCEPR